MVPRRVAPYGTWHSPIGPQQVAAAGLSTRGAMSGVEVASGTIYWRQLRPDQAARFDLLQWTGTGQARSVLPPEFSARTRVHEYGGGDFTVHESVVFFSNDPDQRIYRLDPAGSPQPITPPAEPDASLRYADGRVHPDGQWMLTVCERHLGGEGPVNELVALPTDGRAAPETVASGRDFYGSPRFDTPGERACFLTWDLPNMPWDGTELWVVTVPGAGSLGETTRVAGGPDESIFQPAWGPDGNLYFISDRTDWWNLYRWDGRTVEPVAPMEAEVGSPAWVFGLSRYDFLGPDRIACLYTQDGVDRLGLVDLPSGRLTPVETRFTAFNPPHLRALDENNVVFLASSPTETQALHRMNVHEQGPTELHRPADPAIEPSVLSTPERVRLRSEGGQTVHAFLYPPKNDHYQGPEGARPPLIVRLHGGPTSAAALQLHLEIQFWTSRGFAVADLNYSGSTGFGRRFRRRLYGRWGELDVIECVRLAEHLAETGRVDGDRLLIHGGSAGGFTTLSALTFHDTFAAGASYYGIADAEALVHHTHKFELGYIETLIAPYPQGLPVYRARSPIHHLDRLRSPLILFQGTEDAIVLPEQARQLASALQRKGIPFAYLEFEGEGHGFQRAETVERMLAAELFFYRRLFGLEVGESVAPVEIHNLPD